MQLSLSTAVSRRAERLLPPPANRRAPTREEVDSKVTGPQQKLAELKRAQEELERERAALEETRRRQMEFQTGRQEMVQNLTRGLGLLLIGICFSRPLVLSAARVSTEGEGIV